MRRNQKQRLIWVIALTAWVATIAGTWTWMARYEMTAGATVAQPSAWPGELPFQPAKSGITIVLSVHPKCPCSVATLDELAQFLSHHDGQASADVLFILPPGETQGWERGSLWDQAAKLPNTRLIVDQDGAMSTKLGATTSGNLCAFDSNGKLLFSGGITPSRGHEGDNAGIDSLSQILLGTAPKPPADQRLDRLHAQKRRLRQ